MSALVDNGIIELEQGTDEWREFRRSKITATDACVIMGANPWKTPLQLYNEKISGEDRNFVSEAMQRGLDLEPFARRLFELQTGIEVTPKVIVKEWAMASLDGRGDFGHIIVEIKCPGEKDHALALQGVIPDKYFPQLQHQMYCCDVDSMYYFSFDGIDGVSVKVDRDQEYIDKMIVEEKKFYDCLINKTPPERSEGDYLERNDDLWLQCASEYLHVTQSLKQLELEEQKLKKQLIFLSENENCKGGGLTLCQVTRKGNVDYTKVPELKGVDLEPYRKESTSCWRITQNGNS